MPRASSEARAAAAYRAGQQKPEPPERIGARASEIWREIVAAKAPDFFDAGNLPLLEQYCVAIAAAERLIGEDGDVVANVALYAKLMTKCAAHAQKLRLSIQSALRGESRKVNERQPVRTNGLIGGSAWQSPSSVN